MSKTNRERLKDEIRAQVRKGIAIVHLGLGFITIFIVGFAFVASVTLIGELWPALWNWRNGEDALAACLFAFFSGLLIVGIYERSHKWLHPDQSIFEMTGGNEAILTGQRQGRAFLFQVIWQFLASLAAADLGGYLVMRVFGSSVAFGFIFAPVLLGGTAFLFLYGYLNRQNDGESQEPSPVIRGTLVNTFKNAAMQSLTLLAHVNQFKLRAKSYTIRWAGVELPADTESHFGVVGINGSGKTLALQTLMRSVIPTVRDAGLAPTAQRALIFDPENKLIPFLQNLAGSENVNILNPFDARSQPWDLASDIEDLATAQEMASIFIAEQKGDSQPFWQRTARGILSAVLKALHMKAPGRWTLRQVFHIMTNEPRLTAVLRSTNQTQGLIDLLKPTNQTLFNVLAELRSHMDMLELVAALWDSSVREHGKKPFTLNSWLSGRGVLVFGRPTQLEDTILALNRVLVKRASQLIRAPIPKEEADARGRTWIFLDELRNIGNLPGLDKLLTEGRSRGARVVIAFQDIDGLREVYGERVAEEIANQCDTMSYLRCRGTTAKWAAERLGRSEYWDNDFSSGSSSGPSGSSVSSGTNSRKNITDAVLESELSGLPPVSKQTADGKAGGFVQGWHVVPAIECLYPTRDKDAWYAFENIDVGERFKPRRPEDQILRPWDDETDWKELGFRPDMPTGPFTMPDVDDLRG